ncbi:MAG TPA: glycosyltransferase family 1 protein [Pyrinomonadaceae bacterium]|nr:glycosyltransferase family 1 protein [Pyrinomonadaceae bacterium]
MAPTDATLMYPNELIKMWLRKHNRVEGETVDDSLLNASSRKTGYPGDVVCLSHLRWDFVYQRPQHLLSRAARHRRVYFIEEPLFDDGSMRLEVRESDSGVKVVVPRLPTGLRSEVATGAVLRQMIDRLLMTEGVRDFVLWYYTPMALDFTRHLKPSVTVFDCMDELSAFKGAPKELKELEEELFARADLVFTGGQSLYEMKKSQHPRVHAFPSSIDRDHFMRSRSLDASCDPDDQKDIPHPRLGFFGVVDERFDIELLRSVATVRPDWHFVIVGPVVKIDPAALPAAPNIHYLGSKPYRDLPQYVAGWDVALLLFARNESTKFISPTKTPEYLAAGRPVISTSITDVVRPYGEQGLVEIADTPEEFCRAAERLLDSDNDRSAWLERVDQFLSWMSWDSTWSEMWKLIEEIGSARQRKPVVKSPSLGIHKTGAAGTAGAV